MFVMYEIKWNIKAGENRLLETYLWIEDRKGKSGHIFWQTLMKNLCPDVIVESKKNNSELVKAVKKLQDRENRYIIVLDNSFDNLQAYQEQRMLKEHAAMKKNVSLLDIICFEYILLEFDMLLEWIFAPNDEFLTKRAAAIQARETLIDSIRSGDLNYKSIQEIMAYDDNLQNHNVEQLSAKLLYDLTRNTGFTVSKGIIGECWIKSCCNWLKRQEDDICGLDERRLSEKDKMITIFMGTSLKEEFPKAGLEVIP